MMNRVIKCDCGFSTENKKSFSNHVRYGCIHTRPKKLSDTRCKACGETLEFKKPSKQGQFCNMGCYSKFRHGSIRGAYKSGTVLISGYLYDHMPTHPGATKKGYVAQHRLVAERKIGRYLTKDEVAHHINEIKTDNAEENIIVMTKSEHSKHHQNFRKCKAA